MKKKDRSRAKWFYEILKHRAAKMDHNRKEPFTYGTLLHYLQDLTEEQLQQTVQIAEDECCLDKPVRCLPGVCIGTSRDLYYVDGEPGQDIRSSDDGKHHPEQLVILTDGHGFGVHGDTMYVMKDGMLIGNVSGKAHKFGDTDPEDSSRRLANRALRIMMKRHWSPCYSLSAPPGQEWLVERSSDCFVKDAEGAAIAAADPFSALIMADNANPEPKV